MVFVNNYLLPANKADIDNEIDEMCVGDTKMGSVGVIEPSEQRLQAALINLGFDAHDACVTLKVSSH